MRFAHIAALVLMCSALTLLIISLSTVSWEVTDAGEHDLFAAAVFGVTRPSSLFVCRPDADSPRPAVSNVRQPVQLALDAEQAEVILYPRARQPAHQVSVAVVRPRPPASL
jgi:hypothetical protein